MEKRKYHKSNSLILISQILLSLSTKIVDYRGSLFFIGEPKLPESLLANEKCE